MKRKAADSAKVPRATAVLTPPVTVAERIALAAVLVVAVALRVAWLDRTAVEHFDEGVYASNVWFGPEQDYQYPNRELYAPPLLPFLIEWSIVLLGPTGLAVMLPSLLAGTCLPLVLWRAARDAFGPAAGLFAATAAAGNTFLITYSRAALTDMLLTLGVVTAIWIFGRAVQRGHLGLAALSGFVTALAWWTKYNGWLPLFLCPVGLAVWAAAARPPRRELAIAGKFWLMQVFVAFIIWSPYLVDLQSSGGYARIAANHAQYVVGLSGWTTSLSQQISNHAALDGPLSWIGLGIAVGLGIVLHRRSPNPLFNRSKPFVLAAILLLGALFGAGSTVAIAALALCAASSMPSLFHVKQTSSDHQPVMIPGCLFVSSAGLMLLMTPLYAPYPRLTLPWLALSIVAAAGVFATRSIAENVDPAPPDAPLPVTVPTRLRSTFPLMAATLLMFLAPVFSEDGGSWTSKTAWDDRTGLKLACDEFAAELLQRHRNGEAIVYIHGEPAAFYHLRAAGLPYVAPIQNLEFAAANQPSAPLPVYLLAGPHALRSSQFSEQLAAQADRFTPIFDRPYLPSRLVRLNLAGNISPDFDHYAVRVWKLND